MVYVKLFYHKAQGMTTNLQRLVPFTLLLRFYLTVKIAKSIGKIADLVNKTETDSLSPYMTLPTSASSPVFSISSMSLTGYSAVAGYKADNALLYLFEITVGLGAPITTPVSLTDAESWRQRVL